MIWYCCSAVTVYTHEELVGAQDSEFMGKDNSECG